MKQIIIIVLFVLMIFFNAACDCLDHTKENGSQPPTTTTPPQSITEENNVILLVKEFGNQLQKVSLQASQEIIQDCMKKAYGKYISAELLDKWLKDPRNSPGRLVSSPWPDRIDIQSVIKMKDDNYQVQGEIVEITSTEKPGSGAFSRESITLIVRNINNNWVITDIIPGNHIIYQNEAYDFTFALPIGWKGFSIISERWEGLAVNDNTGGQVVETGPMLSIRHPLWTKNIPRQDIPIMIFTINQWNLIQQEKIHIGAAPIGPSVLGYNHQYYFALPARYNYAFPEGFEEVNQIIESHPLQTKDSF